MPFLLILNCPEKEKDFLIAELLDAGAKGLEERDLPDFQVELRTFFGDEDSTRRQAEQFASHSPRIEWAEDVDWVEIAKSFWKPVAVGGKFFLTPEWEDAPAPEGRIALRMYAGPAFGSGDHATTQLCLQALERHVKPGASVIDVGTGTGILALAAVRLGAGPVFACDIDSMSVAFAAENLAREAVKIGLFLGSTRSVRPGSADIVVANINTTTLELLSGDLMRMARSKVILSGFVEGNEERVLGAMKDFHKVDRQEMDGWLVVVLQRA